MRKRFLSSLLVAGSVFAADPVVAQGSMVLSDDFSVSGRRAVVHVWDGLGVGSHALSLPGSTGLRSGVYGVRLTHGDRVASGRLILLE